MSHPAFKLGVIMLNTHFPRPVGDVGNPQSYPYPVQFMTAPLATPASVVSAAPVQAAVIDGFIDAALALVERGCTAITTSCGFACSIHDQLERAIPVPLVSSSLNLVPTLVKQFGWHVSLPVITYDGRILSKQHFGRFWSPHVVIQGIEDGQALYPVIKNDRLELDPDKAQQDVIQSVARVLDKHPSSKALLFECTNLPPYREAVEKRFGLPVYDIFSALDSVLGLPPVQNTALRAQTA